ncbi:hypothetical protein BS47DRAFT_1324245 [Hydnum rufescens UP504]|uniref:DUF866-domain-containing protein n=1 Tax=Hydnum rufescens UP504 TaxID=1448309 RepID=A0A9P6B967_9AGAM|nr:hypothetical protein BS47DRAFT_1324245 [Hydnum rufescens UP504]
MVRLMLSIKADLENVTDLAPSNDSFDFFFQVKCTSCHETHPKFVGLNRTEVHELSGSKGNTAHFVWRCGMCKRESSAKFDPNFPIRPYTIESSRSFAPLLVLDCRGLEFTDFDPRGMWQTTGVESGTRFTEVDLEDREWTDYDEKVSVPVSIMEIEAKWTKA